MNLSPVQRHTLDLVVGCGAEGMNYRDPAAILGDVGIRTLRSLARKGLVELEEKSFRRYNSRGRAMPAKIAWSVHPTAEGRALIIEGD